uniref:Suppressor of Ty 6 homolog n=1 Tax=Meloidogyne enterolobii TaxID=390850 RepID=A0A6V7Y6S7_MELEN|nr:unnamed protein product [Meloidogyne enterolobii]
MSNFIDNEAELSDQAESAASETSEPAPKRSRKLKEKKRRHQISSDEEDEEDDAEDEDRAREEMKGFVVDDEDEDDEEGGDGGDAGDDESSKAGSDDDLLEDDLDLLNENIGHNVRGRVEISDDEDDRERIKGQLFGTSDFVDDGRPNEQEYQQRAYTDAGSRSESEQSEDPFIVQDEGQRRRHRKKGTKREYSDQVLDEAKDIFGVEDLDEFYEDEEVLEEELEEGEESIRTTRPRGAKVTLLDTIEPSELEKGFVRAEDKKIICEDRPERFQIRKIPVTEIDDHDLQLEALWILEFAFKAQTLSQQYLQAWKGTLEVNTAEEEAPEKIREAIRFIRIQLFEVPFIAFYRKEYVESSLLMPDLWKVYQFDEKWCRLQMRKVRIADLLKRVQKYITESGYDEAAVLQRVTDKDFREILGVQTNEELSDVYAHFQLYYGSEMRRIVEWERIIILQEPQSEVEITSRFKLGSRTDKYMLCIQCGLSPMADAFGLTPEEFAENYTEYVKHEVRQSTKEPNDDAKEYITETFPTPEKVVQGAMYLLAMRFSREPAVRKKLRQIYRQNLLLSIYPTKKGRNEIDESHWLYGRHYIKDKPVNELKEDEYLHYVKAKNDDLIEIDLHIETDATGETNCMLLSLTREPIFSREEYFYITEEWNKLRKEVLRQCVCDILIPIFQREAHERLLEEARDCVIRKASLRLNHLISTEAYRKTFSYEEEDDDMPDLGTRVASICYSADRAEATFAVVIDENGMVMEFMRLVHFTKGMRSKFPDDVLLKKKDLRELFYLIQRRRPHLIVLNSENMDAIRLAEDIRNMLKMEVNENKTFPVEIPVEITNSDAAKVYMNSRMSTQEFVEFPPLLRQAVSLGRFALDPLNEICHLCNTEDDILYMKFHPLQNEIGKSDLLFALQLECINRVNEVGVDINRCLEFPHTAGLLQFVCGLGPRKALHLLKILKQNDNLLESRTKLVTFCRMGPKVFMNAAGFIKIDTAKIAERTDSYVEVLDGSRVHPETYEWARKMAVDALELDDAVDQTVALEEILKAPEKLKELDLDAFAEELTRQGFGNKNITLYDIRAELNYRYKDLRMPHMPPNGEELAQMLLHDDISNVQGKLVLGQILSVAYRKINEKETNLKARWNDFTSTWVCPCCKRDNFKEPTDVSNHFGEFTGIRECPGVPVGLRVRLDNGLMGFVGMRNISDQSEKITDPTKLFKPGQNQYFRVIEFKPDRLECDLSCKSSDLRGEEDRRDKYFDSDRFQEDNIADEKARKAAHEKRHMNSRVTSHPCFHNVTFKDAERMLRKMDLGEAIIRPSGKSPDHLTVTWKVLDDIYQHIQVEEREKKRQFEIGKKLIINGDEFEDLDEILARHIQPMTAVVRDIMSFKYYLASVAAESVQVIDNVLRTQKKNAPQRIPYCITASKKYPGKFVLSYLAQSKIRNEYMSVTPEGLRFRKQLFNSTEDCVNWFKANFAQRPA